MEDLRALLAEIRACRHCGAWLPLGPRPVLRVGPEAPLLIVGQAPGLKVHESGIPWNDLSGERLRAWLEMEREVFYDESRVSIVPMGFCYPGKGLRGDLPPRPECAALWRRRLDPFLGKARLTLAIGQYAIRHHLPQAGGSLAQIVRDWERYLPGGIFPLPHPSPRNIRWRQQHPWFEAEVVPALRRVVWEALASQA